MVSGEQEFSSGQRHWNMSSFLDIALASFMCASSILILVMAAMLVVLILSAIGTLKWK